MSPRLLAEDLERRIAECGAVGPGAPLPAGSGELIDQFLTNL